MSYLIAEFVSLGSDSNSLSSWLSRSLISPALALS